MGLFCRTTGRGKSGERHALTPGQEAWGHVVARLPRELPLTLPELFIEKATVLDNFYVATRYLNGHAEGALFEHYEPL